MKTQSTSPIALHWALRVGFPAEPWRDRELCVWTWHKLQKIFPQCYAAVLMPDHLHVITPALAPEQIEFVAQALRKLQSAIQRRSSSHLRWQAVSEPRTIPNLSHLAVQIRYVHLNPCRKRYCNDPLEWEFSTHRDYIGATAQPWPNVSRILTQLGFKADSQGCAKFHAYISGDPSVHPAGTPAPIKNTLNVGVADLGVLERAFAISQRVSTDATRTKGKCRNLFMRTLLSSPFELPAARIAKQIQVHRSSFRGLRAAPTNLVLALILTATDARLYSALGTWPSGPSK